MAEYIEREKAIAEIDKGDLLVGDNAKWAKEILYRTPTADVVPVVRCKDCKHYKTDSYYCQKTKQGYCELDDTVKQKQGYCSYGERSNKK
jgi:hypothetical protein